MPTRSRVPHVVTEVGTEGSLEVTFAANGQTIRPRTAQRKKNKDVTGSNTAESTVIGDPPAAKKTRKRARGITYDRTVNLPATPPSEPDVAVVPPPPPSQTSHSTPDLSSPPLPDSQSHEERERQLPTTGSPPAFLQLDENTVALPVFEVPRAGPHSPSRNRRQRAAPRTEKAADVWSFFVSSCAAPAEIKKCTKAEKAEQRHCVFCLSKDDCRASDGIYKGTTSTGVLRKHLFQNHIELWVDACARLDISITSQEAKPHVEAYRRQSAGRTADQKGSIPTEPRIPFSKEAFTDKLVDFIVSDDQSLNVVENPYLRQLFLMLREDLKETDIPHRTKIRERIAARWDDYLDILEARLKNAIGKVSTTMDIWSDPNLRPYMAVTAHWIESFKDGKDEHLRLESALIGFREMPGHHSGEHLSTAFIHILDRLNITDKFGFVTLDNASNNDTFVECVERVLRARGIPFDKIHNRVRCFPHIVNLACKAVLNTMTDMDFATDNLFQVPEGVHDDPIALSRELIRNIHSSSLRRQYFSEIVQALEKRDLQLLRDVDTRWSSTLLMLERFELLRAAITQFLSQPDFRELASKFAFSNDDWTYLKKVILILRVPDAFQQMLSAEKTPTLSRALPAFQALISKWTKQRTEMPEMAHVIDEGIEKLEVYRNRVSLSNPYTLALLLNPNQKLRWFYQHDPQHAYEAQSLLIAEASSYKDSPLLHFSPEKRCRNNNLERAASVLEFEDEAPNTSAPKAFASVNAEVEAYLLDRSYIPAGTTPIEYWQVHGATYPTLFRLAMDILPIQGSAVPCERVFSSSKETMSPRRNKIKPKLMEALQMLKFGLRHSSTLDFSSGFDKDTRTVELEECRKTTRTALFIFFISFSFYLFFTFLNSLTSSIGIFIGIVDIQRLSSLPGPYHHQPQNVQGEASLWSTAYYRPA